MPVIKKVLNSSVILVTDEFQKESIILQKGIGYGRKAGESVDVLDEGKVFIPCSADNRKQMLELLEQIPADYLEITRDVVLCAEKELNTSLNEHIYLALTDHIHFAVQRMKEQMIFVNRVFWEMKTFYPREYRIGVYTLNAIEKRLGIRLPEEEAANIAFHIVNAQKEGDSQYDAIKAAQFISQIMKIVSYYMHVTIDQESIHYSRFISHLQYFAKRFFDGCMLESEEDFLYLQMEKTHPRALNCAEKIRTLIVKEYGKAISNEEVAYLAVHIQRLDSRKE